MIARSLSWALSCTLALLVFLISIQTISFSQSFYHKDFAEFGVYDRFGAKADTINSNVLGYLQGKENLSSGFFNAREEEHLSDVRDVFSLLENLSGALIVFLALLGVLLQKSDANYFMRNLKKVLFRGGMIGAIGVAMAGICVLLNFQGSFLVFHSLFFEQGTYLFDASTENIVNLYPQELFYHFAIRIALFALALSAAMIGISYAIKGSPPKKNNNLFKRKKKK